MLLLCIDVMIDKFRFEEMNVFSYFFIKLKEFE